MCVHGCLLAFKACLLTECYQLVQSFLHSQISSVSDQYLATLYSITDWLTSLHTLTDQTHILNLILPLHALTDQFPHQADPDNKNALKQGQVWTYPELLPGPDNKPRGLQVSVTGGAPT